MKNLRVYKKSSIAILVMLVIANFWSVVPEAQAAVAFNTFPVSYSSQTNYDFPLLDAKNITRGIGLSTSQADHNNGLQAYPDDEIEFAIYYHNSGVWEDQATNVIVRAGLPGGSRSSHEVWASIDSDQTGPVFSSDTSPFRGGNMTIHINGGPQTLAFITGSTRFYPNRSTTGQAISGGDNIVTSGVNIGTIRGCFEYSGYVTFRAKVGKTTTTTRDLYLEKRVQNITRGDTYYADSVNANPGDRVKFEIRFETTGSASQTNVTLRDALPSNLQFQNGTLRINGNWYGGDENLFSGNGRNFGTLSSDTVYTVTFEALVNSSVSGNPTLTNYAYVRSNEVSEKQDSAWVYVSGAVTGQNLYIQKRVLNVSRSESSYQESTSANAGQRVRFEIRFETQGTGSQNNVYLRDFLPANLTFVSGTLRINGNYYSGNENLFSGNGRNFGTLSSDTVYTVTFEADIASYLSNQTLTNNAEVRSDQVGTRQDSAYVHISTVSGVQFTLRKTAYNITQGVDATARVANSGDIITYTLFYKNTGYSENTGVAIEDNIADVLELAYMTNTGGAVVDNNIIRFPQVTVGAGSEIARSFQVQVREVSNFPPSSDLVMVNVYGNEVRIPVRKPQVLGAPPRTGAGEWLAAIFATLITAGFWIGKRRRKLIIA